MLIKVYELIDDNANPTGLGKRISELRYKALHPWMLKYYRAIEIEDPLIYENTNDKTNVDDNNTPPE